MVKWILGIIVIALVAAAAAWKFGYLHMMQPTASTEQVATTTQQQSQQQPVDSGLPTSQSDTSDAAMSQDAAAVDTQLSAMTQDSAAIDSSLNDKQTTQSF